MIVVLIWYYKFSKCKRLSNF